MIKNKKTIKVCMVSNGVYPLFIKTSKTDFGGAEVQLYLLGKAINKHKGIEVSYIVGDHKQPYTIYAEGIKLLRGLKHFSLRWPKWKKWNLLDLVVRKSLKILDKLFFSIKFLQYYPDIVIIRSASASVGRWCFWCKLLNIKFIYMVAHEIDCTGEYEKWEPKSGKKFRYGLINADIVIAQNTEQKQALKAHYKKDCIVIPSGYEIANVKKTSEEFILWVGRCEEWKQPELFIKIAQRFPKEKFVMIAPMARHKEEYHQQIKTACKQVHNLEFKDLIPFQLIDEYFKKASVHIITSKYEGFPNTLIQAAKNKTPILSLAINPNGIFSKYKIGFYSNNDIEMLMNNLNSIMSSPELRKILGENAYEYARKNHELNAISKKYIDIFNNLLKR